MSDDRFTIRGITVHKLATSYRHPRKKLTHTQKAPIRRTANRQHGNARKWR